MGIEPENMKEAIQLVIKNLMDSVINKVLVEDPFDREKLRLNKPLYAALVPDEIFKGSHFERRFVTPFGSVWEDLAAAAAKFGLWYGVKGYTVLGTVKSERLVRITQVLNALEHPEKGKERKKPDWNTELAYVLAGGGEDTSVQVVCDVYCESVVERKRYAFELKAPLPNSDQTKVSKEKLFKLYSMDCQVLK